MNYRTESTGDLLIDDRELIGTALNDALYVLERLHIYQLVKFNSHTSTLLHVPSFLKQTDQIQQLIQSLPTAVVKRRFPHASAPAPPEYSVPAEVR